MLLLLLVEATQLFKQQQEVVTSRWGTDSLRPGLMSMLLKGRNRGRWSRAARQKGS